MKCCVSISKKNIFLFFISPLIFVTFANANENHKLFVNGINYYNNDDFSSAISEFLEIINNDVSNGRLFYNLGNGYMKNGDIGSAVLWYERALNISQDPYLNYNYNYAKSLIREKIITKDNSVSDIFFFWRTHVNYFFIGCVGIVANLILWGFFIIKNVFDRHIFPKCMIFTTIISLTFILLSSYHYYELKYIKYAIILPLKVSVRSGVSVNSTKLFMLYAGSKVKIEKEYNNYFRIYLSDDKRGWVKKTEVGVI